MSQISQRTLSLQNGVSQRSADLRLPSQVEAQVNGLSHLTRGLLKRPGSRHIAILDTDETGWERPFVHVIDRGGGEKYYLCIVNGIPRLYDTNGVAQVISFPDGLDYFTLDNEPVIADFTQQVVFTPPDTLTVLGLEDYTFGPAGEYFFEKGSGGHWPLGPLSDGTIEHAGHPEGLGTSPSTGSYWATTPIDDATVKLEMDFAWRNLEPPSVGISAGLGLRNNASTTLNAANSLGTCYWMTVDHGEGVDAAVEGRVQIGRGGNIGAGTVLDDVLVEGLTVGNQSGTVESPPPHWGTGQSGDPAVVSFGEGYWWFRIKFTAHNEGSNVILRAYVDGELVLEVTDSGGSAILTAGWTGFQFSGHGDNITFDEDGGTFVDIFKIQTGSLNVSEVPGGGTGYKALTIGDATVIANTTKTVDINPTLLEEREPEALVYIRSSDYSTNYSVAISGPTEEGGVFAGNISYPTPALTSPAIRGDIATDEIAAGLLANLESSPLPDDFVFTQIGSLIRITRSNGLPFEITPFDGISDDALLVIKDKVQRFEDLPLRCIEGYVVEVTGDPGEEADNYWVQYVDSDLTGNPGVWRECAKPAEPYQWDLSTMPVILTRRSGGSWELKQGEWAPRTCGSVETVPFPSFYTRKINDLFYYQGRLGFLADENVVMSETSTFLNFFQETSKAIFDSDPIDVKASFGKSMKWQNHSLWGERLVLWSDDTQVQVIGDPLTPRTVGFDIIGQYMNSPATTPRVVGDRIFFPQQMSGNTRVGEMFIQQFSRQPTAQEVTKEVPAYIDGVPRVMTGTDQPNFFAVLASDDLDTLTVYLWRWNYDRQEQSSWSKWDFPSGSTIGWITCHDGLLVLFVSRSDGAFLERIDLTEADVVTSTEPLFLDRRIDGADCTPTVVGGETSWTIPFTQAGAVVVRNSTGAVLATSQVGSVLTTTGAQGNLTAVDVTIGVPFAFSTELSRFYVRTRRGNEFDVADVTADVRMSYLTLFLREDSAGFTALVEYSDGRTSYTYTQTAGATEWRIPILASNKKATVTISHSGQLAGGITGYEWEGSLTMRTRRF
jgi:hypothetical protein